MSVPGGEFDCVEEASGSRFRIPFPYAPYPQQRDFMASVRAAIVRGHGEACIIESPTGTGKTQCLLNATLSAQCALRASDPEAAASDVQRRAAIATVAARRLRESAVDRGRRRHRPEGSTARPRSPSSSASSSGDAAAADDPISFDADYAALSPPHGRVFYMARTHSQLSQVSEELERTAFGARGAGLHYVHIAGRQQLCVNDQFRAVAKGSGERLNELCLEAKEAGRGASGKHKKGAGATVELDDLEDFCAAAPATSVKAVSAGCERCEFAQSERIELVADHLIMEPRDLASAVALGRRERGCPFYASRLAARFADVVLVPYSFMVDPTLRRQTLTPAVSPIDVATTGRAAASTERSWAAAELDLSNDVLVFDEGHNVAAAVSGAVSCDCSARDLDVAGAAVSVYLAKYGTRLLTANRTTLRSMRHACTAISHYIRTTPLTTTGGVDEGASRTQLLRTSALTPFTFDAGVDNVDFCSLVRHLEDAGRILRTLRALAERVAGSASAMLVGVDVGTDTELRHAVSVLEANRAGISRALHTAVRLFHCLGGADEATCTVAVIEDAESVQRVLSVFAVSPGAALSNVTAGARCTVLAGGTIAPFDVLEAELFPTYRHESQGGQGVSGAPLISTRIYGHVVGPSQFRVHTVSRGPAGGDLKFVHARRSEHGAMMREVAQAVVSLARVVPGGMVLFFTSYDAEALFFTEAAASGALQTLSSLKQVFREESTVSSDDLLVQYQARVRAAMSASDAKPSAGALISAVLGGKLSEGINFADDYGRCVAVVGLPYPNPNDPKLSLTMRYLGDGAAQARRYYDALCMRSVNQAIGRCLRHAADYAAIVLFDMRYSSTAVRQGLPGWLREHVRPCTGFFGDAFASVRDFFRERRAAPCL